MLFKKDINKKIEHLVKKNDFYAVADYVYGTKEEKLDLAKALGTNDNNSSVDLLLRLVDDKDDDVVYAACGALRNDGSEHNTADLLEKLNNLPKEKEHLREETEQFVCDVDMDEDDYARLLTSEYKECPYYQSNDEYKIVRHQM